MLYTGLYKSPLNFITIFSQIYIKILMDHRVANFLTDIQMFTMAPLPPEHVHE